MRVLTCDVTIEVQPGLTQAASVDAFVSNHAASGEGTTFTCLMRPQQKQFLFSSFNTSCLFCVIAPV